MRTVHSGAAAALLLLAATLLLAAVALAPAPAGAMSARTEARAGETVQLQPALGEKRIAESPYEVLREMDVSIARAKKLRKMMALYTAEAALETDAVTKEADQAACRARTAARDSISKVESNFRVVLDLNEVDPCFKPRPPPNELQQVVWAAHIADAPIHERAKDSSEQEGSSAQDP